MKRLFVVLSLLFLSTPSLAEQPMRLIVPFPAGGAVDVISRVLADEVSKELDSYVIIENRAGASGLIAGMETAKAPADGKTLMMAVSSSHSAVLSQAEGVPYDPVKDFTPITDIGRFTFYLAVNPKHDFKTINDLVAYAKKNPASLFYGQSNAVGTATFAQLNSHFKIGIEEIPYKGEPAMVLDLLAGRINMALISSTATLPSLKDGKLRVIATSLPNRSARLPEVQTIAESVKGFMITPWVGLVGPAGLSKKDVTRFNQVFATAIKTKRVMDVAEANDIVLATSTPEKFASFIEEQLASYTKILKEAGVRPE